jgi:signal transduction histidine kinase
MCRRARGNVAAGGPPPVSEDAEVSIATQSEDASGARSAAEPVSLRANKLDLLERLADDLAHEIKNPLHSMVINLEVLKRRLNRVKEAEIGDVLRYAGVLGEELDRVHRRIELLLRLSRPERAPEETTLSELVDELLELIHLEARHHGTRVTFHRGSDTDRIRVSRGAVRQIILNLVLHALECAGAGALLEIEVRNTADQATLSVRGGPDPDRAPGAGAPRGARRINRSLAAATSLAEGAGGSVRDDGAADGRVGHTLWLPLSARGGNNAG